MAGWTVPDDALELKREPNREEVFSFYGRLELLLRGPAVFAAEVALYFSPQVRPAVTDPAAITIEVLVGGITATALAALPRRPVTLYRSPDGPIPDWNDGIRYTAAPWGVDRLIANPHTGSQIAVTGRHVRVLNPDLRLGVRDAIRVIKQLVTTGFEAEGALIMHAAAFAVDGGAVALVGGKGSGKTTTVLAAVASGATLISNDRLYVWPTSSQTTVVGWTNPIRVIGASPEAPKRVVPLIQYAHGDRSQVTERRCRWLRSWCPTCAPARAGSRASSSTAPLAGLPSARKSCRSGCAGWVWNPSLARPPPPQAHRATCASPTPIRTLTGQPRCFVPRAFTGGGSGGAAGTGGRCRRSGS